MISAPLSIAGTDRDQAQYLGALASACLHLEVQTHPKPGLVSEYDCGAHPDMSAALLHRSADVLAPFFAELAAAGSAQADLPRLRAIGMAAERAMLSATGGVNTHRGAIFGLGLLAAAAGLRRRHRLAAPLGRIVMRRWGTAVLRAALPADSHGAQAIRRYGVGGARAEAAWGFPSVHGIALPALAAGARAAPADAQAARVQACMALIAVVDDTNLLHRGGAAGLAYAQRSAAAFLAAGGVARPGWRQQALRMHAQFCARGLSPGGCADLLAMALFVHALQGHAQP